MRESQKINNLAIKKIQSGDYQESIKLFKKAYYLDNDTNIKNNLLLAIVKYGQFCLYTKKPKKFLKLYRSAIDMGIATDAIVKDFVSAKTHFCDWDNLNRYKSSDPYENILRFPDEKENYITAKKFSRKYKSGRIYKKRSRHRKTKIKIGYLSNGFRDFPTGHNLIEVLESHDKTKFDVYCYSWGEDDKSETRKRFVSASKFTDIDNLNNFEAAQKIAVDNIDILVDLKGFTNNNRFEILSFKPAPIQINYLGYPGTTGADFIDFIIADKTVIPKSNQKYYSEKVIYLNGCYRPILSNDISTKKISKKRNDKAIFASFNMSYKITPEIFKTWMEILEAVPKSVLWLHKSNKYFPKNLRQFAKNNSFDTKKIIFKKDLPHTQHLERLRNVDIALDTYPVNGHSTTADCVSVGVPVITLKGKHFSSRVSESILKSFNLEFLVASNLEDYKNLAVKYGKERLVFDDKSNIKTYTKKLEKAYNEAYNELSKISRRR